MADPSFRAHCSAQSRGWGGAAAWRSVRLRGGSGVRRRGVRACRDHGAGARGALWLTCVGGEKESACDSGRGKTNKKKQDKKTDPGNPSIAVETSATGLPGN